MQDIRLIAIRRYGVPDEGLGTLPKVAERMCASMVSLYQATGFHPPWVGYLARSDSVIVGICAFKAPPREGAVEIAYSTFPGSEGRGIATGMARLLVTMARDAEPSIVLTAQTLPFPGASTSLLRKLGFTFSGTLNHPDDGAVWVWRLPPTA
jgi:ribosomal-protein-alanine N-acetyltransferase